jgi:LysR family transcriptional regulator, hydrogen peroxide-inducible genes activator
MNLTQLRFAHAVATYGSFTGAAEACFVTQPTLSNGVAQLEEELGAPLFARTTRKVDLTPFGTHLMPYIAEALSAQGSVLTQAKAFLEPEQRSIRIGTSPLLNAGLLRPMLEPFRAINPNVEIILREMNMADLYRMLDGDLIDYIFGVVDQQNPRLISIPLYEEPLLFIPRGENWAGRSQEGAVDFSEISEETYVMVPDACGLSRTTRSLFRSFRRKLKEYSGAALSYQVLQDWAALGLGAAILPQSKVQQGRQTSYEIMTKKGSLLHISFEAMWKSSESRATHLLTFEAHLRDVVPSIVDSMTNA